MVQAIGIVKGSYYIDLSRQEHIKQMQDTRDRKRLHLFLKAIIGSPVILLSAPFYAVYELAKKSPDYKVREVDKKIKSCQALIDSLRQQKENVAQKEEKRISEKIRNFTDTNEKYHDLITKISQLECKCTELNVKLKLLIEDHLDLINETGVAFENPNIEDLKKEIAGLEFEISVLKINTARFFSSLKETVKQTHLRARQSAVNKKAKRTASTTHVSINEKLSQSLEKLDLLRKERIKVLAGRRWATRFEKICTYRGAQRTYLQAKQLNKAIKESNEIDLNDQNDRISTSPKRVDEAALLPIRLQVQNLTKASRLMNR